MISLVIHLLKRIYKWLFRRMHQAFHFLGRQYPQGTCTVCGRSTIFIRQRGRHPKDTDLCGWCGAMARYRLLGSAIASILTGDQEVSFHACLVTARPRSGFRVLDTSYRSVLSGTLRKNVTLLMSEYLVSSMARRLVPDLMAVDLKHIPVPDGTLDMVITSDVFEHIDKPWDAFKDIARVLKVGGYHVFTVPMLDKGPTVERATLGADGVVGFTLPPVYHGDPLSLTGTLVFTDFGDDLEKQLELYGFETRRYSITDDSRGFHETKMLVSRRIR